MYRYPIRICGDPVTKQSTEALSTSDLLEELEAGLKQPKRDRLQHPFVLAVESGEATRDQIAGWCHQFGLWADPSNKLFGAMYANCPDDDLRESILENMLEEEKGQSSNTAGHMVLLERTLDEFGWDKTRREQDDLRYESWAFRHWLELVMCHRPFVESIGAVSFAAERINPFVFGKLEKGLRRHYDFSEDGLMFFSVHASDVEEEHGSLGPIAFERYATTPRAQDGVRFAVHHTADMYYQQYGVWRYY